MTTLQNNAVLASQRATALATASQSIASGGIVAKDTQTNLAGNASASSAIDLAQQTATGMVDIITVMSNNIQNLSSAFQAMDQRLGTQLSKISDEARRFSIND